MTGTSRGFEEIATAFPVQNNSRLKVGFACAGVPWQMDKQGARGVWVVSSSLQPGWPLRAVGPFGAWPVPEFTAQPCTGPCIIASDLLRNKHRSK